MLPHDDNGLSEHSMMKPYITTAGHRRSETVVLALWRRVIGTLLLSGLALALGGCIASASRDDSDDAAFRLESAADMDRLAAELADKRIVFIGETHDRMDHHRLQLAVLDALHRSGRDLAVGVEWIQEPFQQPLDDFMADRLGEADMLHRTQYFTRWSFDYRLYRGIIQYSKEQGIPVIALNASKELTSAVSRHGIDDLPEALRDQAPSGYDRTNTEYEAYLGNIYRHHPMADEDGLERFIQVQLTWDETMAEQAAAYLEAHPEKTLVVFAGAGHIAYGAGIPDRVQRRLPVSAAIVLPHDVGRPMPGSADILVATTPDTLPEPGLLGVFLDDGDGRGLVIAAFSEDPSGARDAGLQEGDRLLKIGDTPIPHLPAVKLALIDRAPGDQVNVTYERTTPAGIRIESTAWVTLH